MKTGFEGEHYTTPEDFEKVYTDAIPFAYMPHNGGVGYKWYFYKEYILKLTLGGHPNDYWIDEFSFERMLDECLFFKHKVKFLL